MQAIGIDYGNRNVGIAVGDTDIGIAVPLATFINISINDTVDYILIKADENASKVIIVGMPYTMSGKVGDQAKLVIDFIDALRSRTLLPVEIVDERLSTTEVEKIAQVQFSKKKTRKKKFSKKNSEIDSSAAAIILQSWLDSRIIMKNISKNY
ncbi:MAG: Holliday junction resolvase RuvX [Chloroflexi bacterium]|nr:Holliday junction resolvase RuvX [Chloroflexota bacterium]